MKQWVLGFLIRNKSEVALVMKTHPEWQAGKLNGVGGHIEQGETPLEAMRREFSEEAGIDIQEWREFGKLTEQIGFMHFFVAEGDYPIQSLTDEKVDWYPIDSLNKLPVIDNLPWIVPMALDAGVKYATIDYNLKS